jgi:hypothetical protein
MLVDTMLPADDLAHYENEFHYAGLSFRPVSRVTATPTLTDETRPSGHFMQAAL